MSTPSVRRHLPFDHRDVDAPHRARGELRLQRPLGRRRLGEADQPRRLPIQAVHDEETGPVPALRGHVVRQHPVGRALSLLLGRDGEQTRRLVDDDEILVLVHEAQGGGKHGRRRAQLDAVPGRTAASPRRTTAPLTRTRPGLEPLLARARRAVRERGRAAVGEAADPDRRPGSSARGGPQDERGRRASGRFGHALHVGGGHRFHRAPVALGVVEAHALDLVEGQVPGEPLVGATVHRVAAEQVALGPRQLVGAAPARRERARPRAAAPPRPARRCRARCRGRGRARPARARDRRRRGRVGERALVAQLDEEAAGHAATQDGRAAP